MIDRSITTADVAQLGNYAVRFLARGSVRMAPKMLRSSGGYEGWSVDREY